MAGSNQVQPRSDTGRILGDASDRLHAAGGDSARQAAEHRVKGGLQLAWGLGWAAVSKMRGRDVPQQARALIHAGLDSLDTAHAHDARSTIQHHLGALAGHGSRLADQLAAAASAEPTEAETDPEE